ncbi:DUF2726 domain-containing protein [Shewanella eurypsychrophilus]|uniref:DUF2726 domain-containing protein n=1 Tax=Shewanella eurypsychrophilus TaxID=2593656 RepID=A0ABX6V3Y5_9GAMM|nr:MULTISPECIES: DUF2726 domain-containing protein [Shewanella]QFU21241.1 DUF2726 domain-containing protein [Shewanella sp. YLB-09]QPG56532.1 DUF2726 domain-containing protein [Shewanella eurypsychrophilus]
MNVTVMSSYAFIYFVLFLVVPFVIVIFTMTCIKFFKSDEIKTDDMRVKLAPEKTKAKYSSLISKLNNIAKDKYNVIYGVSLDNILDVKSDKNSHIHENLKNCHLDYVVVDEESSVKLVITDPEHNTQENSDFIDNSLAKVGVNVIHMSDDQRCDDLLIRASLVA